MSRAVSVTLVDSLITRSESLYATVFIRTGAVVFMAVLTALAAQVSLSIPFTQVPFTMQPMVVLMGGLALGPRLGMTSQLVYLAAGIIGLPVFALSATLPPGLLRLLGPSGGYLMVFPLAAFITGYLGARGFDRRYLTSVVAMATGLVVIYAGGVLWLGLFATAFGQSVAVGLGPALATGLYPFVLADGLKLLVAAGVVPCIWRVIGHH
jgi:biotin transport system substrate-specific component